MLYVHKPHLLFNIINEKQLKVQHKKAYFLPLTEFGLMSAPINTHFNFSPVGLCNKGLHYCRGDMRLLRSLHFHSCQ